MGMFDYITCEYPLPDNYIGKGFQSKSLDCLLYTYRITPEGRLMVTEYRLETIPEDERANEWELFRRIDLGECDVNYHGIIEIYDGERSYVVMFTHGIVEKIEPYNRYSIDDSDTP